MTKEQTDIVQQYNSHGGDHKAIILKAADNKFATIIYEWNEEKTDDSGIPVWEKITDPIVLDSLESAQKIAKENLELFSLEIPDKNIEETLSTFIKDFLGHDNFYFFTPNNFEVTHLTDPENETFETITPEKILYIDGICFVDVEGKWITGILEKKGLIKGWKKFDDLKTALTQTIK